MKLAELTKDAYLALDKARVVAVIPLGSMEQHGPHLPMGTDTMQCETIAARAEELNPDVMVVAPVLWVGNSVNHLGLRAAITIDPTRYVSVLGDIGRSFIDQGFRHIFFLNGHGANTGPVLTALHQLEYNYMDRAERIHIAAANWWSIAPEALEEVRDSPPGAAGHACEIETSLMLAIAPGLVQEHSGPTVERHPHQDWATYDYNYPSRVMMVEMIHAAAPDGVIGLPELATEAKGQQLIEDVAGRVGEFIRQFSTW